jgi:hypothetical protein
MSFGQLAKELEQLQQAQPTPSASGGEGNGGNKGGEAPLVKSFKFVLEDGTEVEAADGADLIKSMVEQQKATEGDMLKAMTGLVGLVKGQGELIKSLQTQIAELGGQGRGRRAVVNAGEQPGGDTPPAKPPVDGQALLAKCLDAQAAGRLTANDVAMADSYIGSGYDLPAHIKARLA